MALSFDGVNDSASVSWDSNSNNIVTMVYDMKYNDAAQVNQVLYELSVDYNDNDASFLSLYDGTSGADVFSLSMQDGVALANRYHRETYTRPATGAWTRFIDVHDGSTTSGNERFYKDGSEQTGTVTHTSRDQTDNFRTDTLYVGARNNSSLWLDADWAHFAIYAGELDQADVDQLALGVSPLLIKPSSLLNYWPMDDDSGIDIIRGQNMTLSGPTVVAGPTHFYPIEQPLIVPVAVAGGATIPIFHHHYNQMAG